MNFEIAKARIDKLWVLFMKNKDRQDYPSWICRECAESRGYINRKIFSTYHEGICGWCEEMSIVTEPRDYGFPVHKGKKEN
jgi:hypothetical protein